MARDADGGPGPTDGRIRLLGGLEIHLGDQLGRSTARESTRTQLLLALLILHRASPQRRPYVAGLLWPESTEAQALTNLRHLLHTLRTRVPWASRHVEVTARSLQWQGDEPCWIDVAEFERTTGDVERGAVGGRARGHGRFLTVEGSDGPSV